MPKFMTYQRPTPVNKSSWTGRAGSNPYQPVRRAPPSGPTIRLPKLVVAPPRQG